MNFSKVITSALMVLFFILLGFAFRKAIVSGSVMGILMASISLLAAIHFFYLLYKASSKTR